MSEQSYSTSDGASWICTGWEVLCEEIAGLAAGDLPQFHAVISMHKRPWMIARRIFGLRPRIPHPDEHEDDIQQWSRVALEKTLGLKQGGMKSEIDAIRGLWGNVLQGRRAAADAAVVAKASAVHAAAIKAEYTGELAIRTDDQLLLEYGFSPDMFELENAPKWHRPREEKQWMVGRIRDLKQCLDQKMARELTRAIIQNELQIRRCQTVLTRMVPGGESYGKISATLKDCESTYKEQLRQLDEIMPYAGVVAGSVSLKAFTAEFTIAHQEWYGQRSERRVDGIFTAAEVQILMRVSVQDPVPKYRADIVALLHHAKANLWDPEYANTIPHGVLAKLRRGWLQGEKAVREASGEVVTDLLADGSSGEYPPLAGSPETAESGLAKESAA